MRLARSFSSVLFLLLPPVAGSAGEPPRAAMPEKHRALFQEHCVSCHNADKQKGKFRLDDLPFGIADIETAERWQKILNQLNSGEMPPEDEKQPPNGAKTDLLDDLANAMVVARKSLGDRGGEIAMRRLNRREYRNTLRELLGIEANVSDLPDDTGSGHFDTVGSNLFMSGNQFEQYLAVGREALEEAFEWQAAAGVTQKYRYEAEETRPILTQQRKEAHEAYARARQWAAEVDAAAAKPENAAIVARLRREAKDDALFRRSWNRIPGAPAPESFGFQTVENNADKANRALGYMDGYFKGYEDRYFEQPHLDTGAYLCIHHLNKTLSFLVPFAWKDFVGDYVVRVRVGATDQAAPERRFMEFGVHPRHGQVLSTHHITGTIGEPQIVEIPITLTRNHKERDNRTLFVREKGTDDHINQTRARFGEGKSANGIGPDFSLWVDWMEIERLPSADRPAAPGLAALEGVPCDDKSPPPAPEILRAALERFATAAFRGTKPQPSYLDRLAGLHRARLESGAKPGEAFKETLAIVLSSPQFLYLAEPGDGNQRGALTGQELATRLSYFIWGAPPDAALRRLALDDELARPAVLAAQTDRLLDDPRSGDFVRAFTHQWLGLDRLDFFEIDGALHPRYDEATKLASRNEVYETFAHLLRENGRLGDLLKSDYAVIDPVLASYYGIEGVTGGGFRKVALPAGSPRGGLLGMAAVSVMGGNGARTNPVERGAWVLRKLLDDPPPPAPANVPQIARLAGKVLTTRERLIAHQEEAQCASCHRKIDPIGFGLENFDAAGKWRTEDSYQVMDDTGKPVPNARKTWTIDPASAFHNGPAFRDYFELRDLIAGRTADFARGFSRALIEYGLGRPVGFRDEELIESMLARARERDFATREFFHALVGSEAFRRK